MTEKIKTAVSFQEFRDKHLGELPKFPDEGYPELEDLIARRVAEAKDPLFATDASGLFDAYLAGLPDDRRQHYNCNCCRRFVERFGGLVRIGEGGKTIPALWDDYVEFPSFFRQSVFGMAADCRAAKVTGVFLSSEKIWGTPSNVSVSPKYLGTTWTHLHGENPSIFKHALQTADQAMAEKLQDYIMLKVALSEFPQGLVAQSVRVLEADALSRSEKTLGVAKWLLELHERIEAVKEGKWQQNPFFVQANGRLRDNLIWLAVATAPPGFCHVRSTMIGTLLSDLATGGMSFEAVQRRWAEKMHPLQYQRPTAIKEGNVKVANEIIAKLQAEGALARRYAKAEELTSLWMPTERPVEHQKTGGAFDHLLRNKKVVAQIELPTKLITWEKFCRDVLLTADEMEVQMTAHRMPFFAFVTAVSPDAPPILQWDGLIENLREVVPGCIRTQEVALPRNPVSWYFRHGGSYPRDWNIKVPWAKVSSVCLQPSQWQQPEKFAHQGEGAYFVLENCRHTENKGGSFFPDTLRAEFHAIRKAMEAFSEDAEVQGKDEATACGVAIQKATNFTAVNQLTVRVKNAGGSAVYKIDRWE